jgi:hypothetical protein
MNDCSILAPHGPLQPNDAIPQGSRRVFTFKRAQFYLGVYVREPHNEISKKYEFKIDKSTGGAHSAARLKPTVPCAFCDGTFRLPDPSG